MFTEFDKSLIKELESVPISRENVKTLIKYGANINAEEKYKCLMESVLGYYPWEKAEFLPEIVKVAIENGWDTEKQGLKAIEALVFSTATKEAFYAEKLILENGVKGTEEEFNKTLETIGTEESYQRCCEHNREGENLYYVMYEVLDAVKQGKSITGIDHYSNALGMTVEKIVYFDKENTLRKTDKGTEYTGDIGFVNGDKVLFVTTHVNVLFKNDLLKEAEYIQKNDLFEIPIVGTKIQSIEFSNRTITKKNTEYNQPIIILNFDNGYRIKFTHNFGEIAEHHIPRFEILN